jgi:endonuclease YncB( thermonuclease family)
MHTKWAIGTLLVLLSAIASIAPVFAADSLYGRITSVRSADVVVLNYGKGEYIVRIVGIVPPSGAPARAREARQFVSNLLLGKNARMRLERRGPNNEMIARLYTDEPANGVKDVGLELLKAGLVRHEPTYDGKYGEMAAAENEARTARRGLWSAPQPR